MIIKVSHTISMGHRLPSYNGICASPHGHNIVVDVEVETGDRFIDFKEVHFALATVLEDFDHAMVLHDKDPLAEVLLSWPVEEGQQPGFRVVTLDVEPTTEAIAQYIFSQLCRKYLVQSVTVHETAKYSARVSINTSSPPPMRMT